MSRPYSLLTWGRNNNGKHGEFKRQRTLSSSEEAGESEDDALNSGKEKTDTMTTPRESKSKKNLTDMSSPTSVMLADDLDFVRNHPHLFCDYTNESPIQEGESAESFSVHNLSQQLSETEIVDDESSRRTPRRSVPTTMTQYSRSAVKTGSATVNPNASSSRSFHFNADKTKCFRWRNGKKDEVFQVRDCWRSSHGYVEHVFTIQSFQVIKHKYIACCRVHTRMQNTFLTEDSIPPELAKAWVEYDQQQHMELDKLDVRVVETDRTYYRPQTHCFWEPPGGEFPTNRKLFSKGFAYRQTGEVAKIKLKHKPRAVDVCAGAGGMSKGLSDAGFEVGSAIEKDSSAAASHELNFPQCTVYVETIQEHLNQARCGNESYPKPGDAEHVHGSPPCQAFSRVNTTGGKDDEANAQVTDDFTEFIVHNQFQTLTFENVPGMIDDCETRKGIKHLRKLIGTLVLYGYSARHYMLNAQDFGDPQNRQRLIVAASIRGVPLSPCPTPPSDFIPVTPRDVLSDLEQVEPAPSGYYGRVHLPNGLHTTGHFCHGGSSDNTCTLNPDEPCGTIRTQTSYRHYSKDRNVTVRELARLQSFPDSFRLVGSPAEQKRQIGNAVPVNLATVVAKTILENCYTVEP